MIQDVLTIVRKEFMEILHQRGSRRAGWLNIVIVVGLLGIYMPITSGRTWVTNPIGLISFAWLPLFLVMGIVADGFAGERERHTLETLLASRLSDSAILAGKIAAAVLYAWGIAMVSTFIGGIVANFGSDKAPGFVFYPASWLAIMASFSLLLAILVASLGTLVSLRASTVRQAYQQLSIGFMVLWFGFFIGIQLLPETAKLWVASRLETLNLAVVGIGAFAILVIADLALIAAARLRFQRAKLILD
jgi:ABC-2 type transport system permease protein